MITIINDKNKIEIENINELYKWIKNENSTTLNNTKVEGNKEAEDLFAFFKFYFEILEECKESITDVNNNFIDNTDNKLVVDATKELIRMNKDGKFIRAALIALGYYSKNLSSDNKEYLPLATAYETFQTSILIHDDIIDNADLRRGKITIPKSYSNEFEKSNNNSKDFHQRKTHIANSLGICIGDLGFYLASKILISNYRDNPNFDRLLNLYNTIVINTIKGEIIDVLLPFNEQYCNVPRTTEDDVMEIYRLKTAWYSIIGPFSLGMVLANYSDEEIKKMQELLYNLGIGFQIKDDILGIFGDEKELGKSASSDVSEFKQTILYSYIAQNNPEELENLHKYYGVEGLKEEEMNNVKDIFTRTGARKYATDMMESMFNETRKTLANITFINEEYKQIISGFITYLDFRTK